MVRRIAPAAGCALLVAVLELALSGGGAAGNTADKLRWSASSPFRVHVSEGPRRLTTLGGGAPVTFVTATGEHQLTRILSRHGGMLSVATTDVGRTARVTIRRTALGLRLAVRLVPAGGVQELRVTLAASRRTHFLGTGQRDRWVDMRGTVVPLKTWNECASSAPAPFFAGSGGFGAYLEGHAVGRIAFPFAVDDSNFACDLDEPQCSVGAAAAAVRICVKAARAALEVFPGTPAEIVSAYATRVGRPKQPWLPHFALIKWRDEIAGPEELFDDIEQLRKRGLPIGWVLLDNPWEEGASRGGCFGSLRFDPVRYPDPAGLIRRIHQRGVRFMLWISPQLRLDGCSPEPQPRGWVTGDEEFLQRDLSNPDAYAEFVQRLSALAALGVDGFKGDRGDEVDLEDVHLHGGSGVALHNLYPRWFHEATAEAMRPHRRRWASLFRTSTPGSASVVPGFWGGDFHHSFDGLERAVKAAQTAGVAGAAMWGSDIGGYKGGDLSAEVFVRWAQFGALTPVFEVGGAGANARFWRLGPDAVEGFRRAATLHYELVPYLYELVRGASRTGLPAIRPLGLTWPRDERSWRSDLQFTVGDALLAAPVIRPANGGVATTPVYLPPVGWIDLFTGARHSGPGHVTRRSGSFDFPLYVREGSALPYNFRAPAIWSRRWRADDLVRAGRQGWLVAPAPGQAARARAGASRLVATHPSTTRTHIVITRAAREQQLLVLAEGPVCRVTIDGRAAPRVTSAAALRTRARGWLVERAPRRGVVVKARNGPTVRVALSACR